MKKIYAYILLLTLLLAACQAEGEIETATDTAVPDPTDTLSPAPTETPLPEPTETAVPPRDTPTIVEETAVPTIEATATITAPITNDVPFTYTSEAGGFAINLPADSLVYEELFPSVDGVFVEQPDSVSIIHPAPNFGLNVHWYPVVEGMETAEFIDEHTTCVGVSSEGGEDVMVDEYEARLFANVACGPVPTSYVYLVTPSQGYIFNIVSMTGYDNISDFVWDLLDTAVIE
jgi:hypothetical protein